MLLRQARPQLQRLGPGCQHRLRCGHPPPGRQPRLQPGHPLVQRHGHRQKQRRFGFIQWQNPEILLQRTRQPRNRISRVLLHARIQGTICHGFKRGIRTRRPISRWHHEPAE
jgi:hypothetical protein